ncbi:hypothetical protein COV61_04040, partial [Candidatus Micrarchaeota archaeon CG11_big_fil_rev_8_21_14_0_20_47_5]
YVRNVVSAYRSAIDSGSAGDLSKFTARGYTGGYLFGQARKEKLTSSGAPAFSGSLIGQVIKADKQGAHVRLSSPIRIGDSIRASSSGKIIEIFRIYSGEREVPEAKQECTLKIKTIRTGDTLYKVARAQIEDRFLKGYSPLKVRSAKEFSFESKELPFAPIPDLFYLKNRGQLQENRANPFVVPLESFSSEIAKEGKIVVDTPRVAFDEELPELERKIKEISEEKPFAFMASEPSLVQEYGTILSPYANVTNTLAVEAWRGFGNVVGAVASLEVSHLQEEYTELGFMKYSGYPLELMISENDLFFELGMEGKCELEDPRGNRFEIIRRGGRTVILKGKEGVIPEQFKAKHASPDKGKEGNTRNKRRDYNSHNKFRKESNTQTGRNGNTQRRREGDSQNRFRGKGDASPNPSKGRYGNSSNQGRDGSPQNRGRFNNSRIHFRRK